MDKLLKLRCFWPKCQPKPPMVVLALIFHQAGASPTRQGVVGRTFCLIHQYLRFLSYLRAGWYLTASLWTSWITTG